MMWKPKTAKDYLELICDIAADYDGYNDVENLKDLIDEIRGYAAKALIILMENKYEEKHN